MTMIPNFISLTSPSRFRVRVTPDCYFVALDLVRAMHMGCSTDIALKRHLPAMPLKLPVPSRAGTRHAYVVSLDDARRLAPFASPPYVRLFRIWFDILAHTLTPDDSSPLFTVTSDDIAGLVGEERARVLAQIRGLIPSPERFAAADPAKGYALPLPEALTVLRACLRCMWPAP